MGYGCIVACGESAGGVQSVDVWCMVCGMGWISVQCSVGYGAVAKWAAWMRGVYRVV